MLCPAKRFVQKDETLVPPGSWPISHESFCKGELRKRGGQTVCQALDWVNLSPKRATAGWNLRRERQGGAGGEAQKYRRQLVRARPLVQPPSAEN